MCLICVEFQKQRMTTREARSALREMSTTLEDEHVEEVREMIQEAEETQDREEDDASTNP